MTVSAGLYQPLSGIQYGFEWGTDHYRERSISYLGQPVVYYQFATAQTENEAKEIQVVPDGCVDLLFCCDGRSPEALVCGTVLRGRSISLRSGTVYFGVRLSARLSIVLPGLSLKDVIEEQAPFEDSLSSYADMSERIAECAGFAERIACFERRCPGLLNGSDRSIVLADYCLTELQRTDGGVSIRELAEGTGYSERYLRKKFEQSFGFSPKLYGRIVRFQRTLEGIVRSRAPLAEVAIERGYFDQAHFLKDFKEFSPLTPQQLRARADSAGDG